MAQKYSFQNYSKEHAARAIGSALPISIKKAVEVCNVLRNMRLEKAKRYLERVVEGTQAVPYRRSKMDLGHKRGIGPGRYPKKTAAMLIRLLNSVEANAQFKGLSTADLVISHISPNRASCPWHFGRQRRTKMKRTHVEIVVEEKKSEKKPEKSGAPGKDHKPNVEKKESKK